MSELSTKPAKPAAESDWGSRNHVRTLVLMGVTLSGLYVCYRLAVPFLPAAAWALALAVLFTPLQRRLELKLKRSSLAALISVLLIALIVVGPTTWVTQQLVQETAKGAETIQEKIKSGEWKQAVEAQPRLAYLAGVVEKQVDVSAAFNAAVTGFSTAAKSIVKTSLLQVVGLCLTFYLLFFFLRDRRECIQSIRALSPLTATEMDRLLSRVDDTIYATVYGTLAVSAAQGLLGGLMFWWLGLPSPLLWGAVMAVLAVVPLLGTFVVWLPAALYLLMSGSWEKGLILILWGMLVVGTIDNFLRPILAGKRLKLHTVLAFISVVGGLMLFGAAGLILGPVLLTITMVLLEIWSTRTTADEEAAREAGELARFESEGGLTPDRTERLVVDGRSEATISPWAMPPPPLT